MLIRFIDSDSWGATMLLDDVWLVGRGVHTYHHPELLYTDRVCLSVGLM